MDENNIFEILSKAVYPQMKNKDADAGKATAKMIFADMVCIFYFEMKGMERLYLMEKMREVLNEEGYGLSDVAFKNYLRDLTIKPEKLLYKIEAKDIELIMLYGTLNMGAALVCDDLLKELRKLFEKDYVILGVLEDALILGDRCVCNDVSWCRKIREELQNVLKESFLSDVIFMYRDGKLKNFETGEVCERGGFECE